MAGKLFQEFHSQFARRIVATALSIVILITLPLHAQGAGKKRTPSIWPPRSSRWRNRTYLRSCT